MTDLVRKPIKWQEKILQDTVTTTSTEFLEFTGLTVGQTYVYSGTFLARFNPGGDFFRVYIKEGENLVKALPTALEGSPATTVLHPVSFRHVFTATETSIKLITSAIGAGELVEFDSSGNTTWAVLEEKRDYVQTSEW